MVPFNAKIVYDIEAVDDYPIHEPLRMGPKSAVQVRAEPIGIVCDVEMSCDHCKVDGNEIKM